MQNVQHQDSIYDINTIIIVNVTLHYTQLQGIKYPPPELPHRALVYPVVGTFKGEDFHEFQSLRELHNSFGACIAVPT